MWKVQMFIMHKGKESNVLLISNVIGSILYLDRLNTLSNVDLLMYSKYWQSIKYAHSEMIK